MSCYALRAPNTRRKVALNSELHVHPDKSILTDNDDKNTDIVVQEGSVCLRGRKARYLCDGMRDMTREATGISATSLCSFQYFWHLCSSINI